MPIRGPDCMPIDSQNAARNTVNESRQTAANVTKIADISKGE
jgi:hypothetical protein